MAQVRLRRSQPRWQRRVSGRKYSCRVGVNQDGARGESAPSVLALYLVLDSAGNSRLKPQLQQLKQVPKQVPKQVLRPYRLLGRNTVHAKLLQYCSGRQVAALCSFRNPACLCCCFHSHLNWAVSCWLQKHSPCYQPCLSAVVSRCAS